MKIDDLWECATTRILLIAQYIKVAPLTNPSIPYGGRRDIAPEHGLHLKPLSDDEFLLLAERQETAMNKKTKPYPKHTSINMI